MGKFALRLVVSQEDEAERAKNILYLMVRMGASEAAIQEKMSQFSVAVQDAAINAVKAERGVVDK